MTALAAFALVLVVAVGVLAGALVKQRQATGLRYLGELVRLRVIVHTKDERSIRGVLLADYPDCIVLDAPEYLGEPEVQTLAGRAVVLRDNLGWIQVLGNDGS